MSSKLAIYFLGQGDSIRVLDAEHPPQAGYWTVGRSALCDIVFRLDLVSKRHARITVAIDEEASIAADERIYSWKVLDTLSTNSTYVEDSGDRMYRCAPNVAYEIKDRALIQFGCRPARVRCSFDVDDTMSQRGDDGVSTGLHDRRKEPRPTDESPETMIGLIAAWGPSLWDWFKALPLLAQLFVLSVGSAAAVIVAMEVWGS